VRVTPKGNGCSEKLRKNVNIPPARAERQEIATAADRPGEEVQKIPIFWHFPRLEKMLLFEVK